MSNKPQTRIDLERLKGEESWKDFVWDGVSSYWVEANNLTYLNRILEVARKLGRHQSTLDTLARIAAHSIDVDTGLFKKGVNKRRKSELSNSWHRLLTEDFGHQSFRGGPPVLTRIKTMSIGDTVRLWRNCVQYLADPQKRSRWKDSRIVIQALNEEWSRRQLALPEDGDYFEWPDTDAKIGHGTLSGEWLEEGLLSYLGYRVGNTQGVSTDRRRRILTETFYGVVPPVFPPSYIGSWGNAGSAHRLQKLAETIAAFARNAKRRQREALETAIDQWEADLEFLYSDYYVGRFHFSWPKVE